MSKPRVLVVDDEPNMRWTMGEFLKRAGYDPVPVADFDEAAAALDSTAVDAAVVDIVLPRRSGVELLKEFAGREPYVPFVMITGEPNSSLVPDIVRAGAYDFIAKPILKEALIKAVARAVERKRLVEEKARLEEEVRRYAAELEVRVSERTAELVEAHKRLAHQEKIAALGRAAAQVAHEVKNPLAGLLLYSMHLRNKAAGKLSESELTVIDKIVNTINHLTATVNQVLDYARPVQLSPRPVDLNQVVSDVLQLLRPQSEAARVEQRTRLDPAGCRASVDEPSMRSALLNLCLNAVQAMPGGGTLTVRTQTRGGAVLVEIEDTGRGMTEEQLKNIFEPFYTTKSQGLGLGMSYAQKIVEQHRGTVAIESRPGAGTTIRVELPGGAEEGAADAEG
ncbi:MAG TPA: ATP-binding protein [Pyrinomonadaceae bacterium]|nr:ATP-binding protein [Pyrinomonadaceae bacterium]